MNNFLQLNIPESLKKSLSEMKFNKPTEIQAKSIPAILDGRDFIGCANTGTGKTAAFGIPMVTQLNQNTKTALVLVPTRELAMQVNSVLKQLTKHTPELKVALLIGGNSVRQQLRDLSEAPRIIVATPGRLLDHLTSHKSVKVDTVSMLVLDEADRMLDMGFAPQLDRILGYLPKKRQTLLFSATFPFTIQALAGKFLKNPVKVVVGAISKPAAQVKQAVIETTQQKKNDILLDELNARSGSVIIFTRTQHRTDRLFQYLKEYGYEVNSLHGGRTQGQRNSAIAGFRSGDFRVLVATDIASRGIDISHVEHVINYDLPQTPEDYIHRIGRTGRAGAKGNALSFLIPEEKNQWKAISRLMEKKSH